MRRAGWECRVWGGVGFTLHGADFLSGTLVRNPASARNSGLVVRM